MAEDELSRQFCNIARDDCLENCLEQKRERKEQRQRQRHRQRVLRKLIKEKERTEKLKPGKWRKGMAGLKKMAYIRIRLLLTSRQRYLPSWTEMLRM